MTWIAALPMYNVTPALAADWRALLDDVLQTVAPLAPDARAVDPVMICTHSGVAPIC